MNRFRSLSGVAAALSIANVAFGDEAPRSAPHTLSLDDCVASALTRNTEARSSDLDVTAATEARSGAKGELFPKLHAEGSLQQWDRPFDLPFGPQTFRVRDPFTWNATVTVMQPLTGLLDLYRRYKVEAIGVDVAELRKQVVRRDLAYRVAETYLRLLEAERLAEIAKASIAQLDAQRTQAHSLLTNGVIAKNDELRAELALASAKQREIQARGQVVVVRTTLAALIGTPEDSALEAAPLAGDAPPSEDPSVEAATSRALEQRVELREIDERIAREDARASAQRARLYPTVSAVGAYMHVAGSAFQLADSGYVGAVAGWDVWDWGSTASGVRVAEARRDQVKLARDSAKSTIRVEVSKAFVELASAKELLTVARAAREQAEENYRIVSRRFEQNAATSFDVVDAEALLTSTRAQVESAYYGVIVARLSLQRATGGTSPRLR